MLTRSLIAAFAAGYFAITPAKAETQKLETINVEVLNGFPLDLEQRIVGVFFRNENGAELKRFHGFWYDKQHIVINWHGLPYPIGFDSEAEVASIQIQESNKYPDLSKHVVIDSDGNKYNLNSKYCPFPDKDLAIVETTEPYKRYLGELKFQAVEEGHRLGIILMTEGSIELRYGQVTEILREEKIRNYDSRVHNFEDVFRTTIKGRTGNSGGIGFYEDRLLGLVSFGTPMEGDKNARNNLGLTKSTNIPELIKHCL